MILEIVQFQIDSASGILTTAWPSGTGREIANGLLTSKAESSP